jgi:acyl-CoA thioesterase
VAALLGRSIEGVASGALGEGSAANEGDSLGMFVARITLELLRPVPCAPLQLMAEVVRPGRKVQLVQATLLAAGKPVARATGLLIRQSELALPRDRPPPAEMIAPPEQGVAASRFQALGQYEAFHSSATEHRFVRGQDEDRGPAADWIRLKYPLLRGEVVSPLCRACVASDFGNGVSSVLRADDFTYINPDLTIYLHRYPQGEWVCIDASSRVESTGVGLVESHLFDRDGRIGCALQSLIVEARPR